MCGSVTTHCVLGYFLDSNHSLPQHVHCGPVNTQFTIQYPKKERERELLGLYLYALGQYNCEGGLVRECEPQLQM